LKLAISAKRQNDKKGGINTIQSFVIILLYTLVVKIFQIGLADKIILKQTKQVSA